MGNFYGKCQQNLKTQTCVQEGVHDVDSPPENNRVRVENAKRLLGVYNDGDPRRLNDIATGEEMWVYFFEPTRKP